MNETILISGMSQTKNYLRTSWTYVAGVHDILSKLSDTDTSNEADMRVIFSVLCNVLTDTEEILELVISKL